MLSSVLLSTLILNVATNLPPSTTWSGHNAVQGSFVLHAFEPHINSEPIKLMMAQIIAEDIGVLPSLISIHVTSVDGTRRALSERDGNNVQILFTVQCNAKCNTLRKKMADMSSANISRLISRINGHGNDQGFNYNVVLDGAPAKLSAPVFVDIIVPKDCAKGTARIGDSTPQTKMHVVLYGGQGKSACIDKDGCSGRVRCSRFSTIGCTDKKAPDTGFNCGPCPAKGFTGDGKKCVSTICKSTSSGPQAGPCGLDATACTDLTHTLMSVTDSSIRYKCTCKQGFKEINGACTKAQKCADSSTKICSSKAVCLTTSSGDSCKCGAGYNTFDNGLTCNEIDACLQKPCFAGVTCFDKNAPQTGYTCKHPDTGTICPPGFTPTGDSQICKDVDDCVPQVKVLNTNHKVSGDTGAYFYFQDARWANMIGQATTNGGKYNVYQYRSGKQIWSGEVIIWDNANGVHGRKNAGNGQAGDWSANDIIKSSDSGVTACGAKNVGHSCRNTGTLTYSCACGSGYTKVARHEKWQKKLHIGNRCEKQVKCNSFQAKQCDAKARCNGVASSDKFTCTCPAGVSSFGGQQVYFGTGLISSGGCKDFNGCAATPCFKGVECIDVKAPGYGYKCMGGCPLGKNKTKVYEDSGTGLAWSCWSTKNDCQRGDINKGQPGCRASKRCEAGKVYTGSKCASCPNGKYASAASVNCTSCTEGTADEDNDPSSPCTKCGAGKYSASGASTCTPYGGSCTNGELPVIEERLRENHCGTCNKGSRMVEEACLQWSDKCPNGNVAALEDRIQDDQCASCNSGFFLTSAKTCNAWHVCESGEYEVRILACSRRSYQYM